MYLTFYLSGNPRLVKYTLRTHTKSLHIFMHWNYTATDRHTSSSLHKFCIINLSIACSNHETRDVIIERKSAVQHRVKLTKSQLQWCPLQSPWFLKQKAFIVYYSKQMKTNLVLRNKIICAHALYYTQEKSSTVGVVYLNALSVLAVIYKRCHLFHNRWIMWIIK